MGHPSVRVPKLCDNGREGNQCRLSFHDLCYKQHWNEIKAYKKCICRHCAVCTCGLVLRKEVVGDSSICNANMHLECARKLDFYCIGCHHAERQLFPILFNIFEIKIYNITFITVDLDI
jgi:hypothetical protein